MPHMYTYTTFKKECLVENLCDRDGKPKHTRFIKRLFYQFNEELKAEFGFDLHQCDQCKRNDWDEHGPFMMELEHTNRITNDSRISNLRSLCPICHQRTFGYSNRSVSIEEHYNKMWGIK